MRGQHVHQAHDVGPQISSDEFFLRLDGHPSRANLFRRLFQQHHVDHERPLPAQHGAAGFVGIIQHGFIRGARVKAAEAQRVGRHQPLRFFERQRGADVGRDEYFFIHAVQHVRDESAKGQGFGFNGVIFPLPHHVVQKVRQWFEGRDVGFPECLHEAGPIGKVVESGFFQVRAEVFFLHLPGFPQHESGRQFAPQFIAQNSVH